MSKELTEQMINDYLPHLKPEACQGFREMIQRIVDDCGEVIKREKKVYLLDNSLYDYEYTFENGDVWILDAVRMGLLD